MKSKRSLLIFIVITIIVLPIVFADCTSKISYLNKYSKTISNAYSDNFTIKDIEILDPQDIVERYITCEEAKRLIEIKDEIKTLALEGGKITNDLNSYDSLYSMRYYLKEIHAKMDFVERDMTWDTVKCIENSSDE